MKRITDLLFSISAVVFFSPFLLILTSIILMRIGPPVFFKHLRPGKHSKPFRMYKFRTMTNEKRKDGKLLKDEERLTTFGKILRETSMDELPELFNILKGDMSIVGPRPLLMRYLDRYTSEQARRHEVKPGLTGWAQVNGRNAISWEEKFKLDVWYVDHQSFWLDMKIILMTIKKVLKREGINAAGEATMPEFNPPIRLLNSAAPLRISQIDPD